MSYDPSSDKVALYYTGNDAGEPSLVNVPARDLTESDMARLESIEGSDPEERLLAGPYRKTKPKGWKDPNAEDASGNASATESNPAEASGASANPAESEAESAKEDAK